MLKNLSSQNSRRGRRSLRGVLTVVFGGALMAAIVSLTSMNTEAAADSQTKRFLLIGATANSAPYLINQGLEAGYEVIGLARRPEEVKIEHERLTLVKGDVYDLASLENAFTGDEVIISYLSCCSSGDVNDEITEEIDLFSRGTANIIQAMKNKGNRRLIVVSTTGVEHIFLDKPAVDAHIVDKLLWNRRRKYDDERRMEVIIRESELDYIIVRPGRVIGDQPQGTYNIFVNTNTYDSYNRRLARPDLATFILDQLESDEYIGTTVGVYN